MSIEGERAVLIAILEKLDEIASLLRHGVELKEQQMRSESKFRFLTYWCGEYGCEIIERHVHKRLTTSGTDG